MNRATGDIYVGSATRSTDLSVTANALQPVPGGGGWDGLIARYSNAGDLLSLSYVGGPVVDRFEGILAGTNGNVYLSGIGLETYSTVGPSGPLGGGEDAAGLILSPTLGQVLFGIQLGGTDSDNGRAVAPMPDGGFVIAGIASSSDFPARHAQQPQYGGSTSDGWIGRIISALTTLSLAGLTSAIHPSARANPRPTLLARDPASLPQLWRRTAFRILVQDTAALLAVRACDRAPRGGLSGRCVHVQHRRVGADLRRDFSGSAVVHLARATLAEPADCRSECHDPRSVPVLSLFQDAVPGV